MRDSYFKLFQEAVWSSAQAGAMDGTDLVWKLPVLDTLRQFLGGLSDVVDAGVQVPLLVRSSHSRDGQYGYYVSLLFFDYGRESERGLGPVFDMETWGGYCPSYSWRPTALVRFFEGDYVGINGVVSGVLRVGNGVPWWDEVEYAGAKMSCQVPWEDGVQFMSFYRNVDVGNSAFLVRG